MKLRIFRIRILPAWILLFGSLQVYGQAENTYQFLTYSNRENRTLSIELDAYHTVIPEKIRLSYILEGFDKEWIHVNRGSSSPTYTNLTPGDYTFRVKALNSDGIISESETSLQITMLAPWFARTSSKLLFIVLALSLISVISLYVVKLKNLQKEYRILEASNKTNVLETVNRDSEFIKTVHKAIRENLDDSSFGVEELASEANLSTSQLYRKMKLVTGQVPNAFLRDCRLQAAVDLLASNPGISVKSIMYEVGFESASHFSHAFKKKFGYSPSERSQMQQLS